VPFKPDSKRPIFCKDCYKKSQVLLEQGKIPNQASYLFYDEESQTLKFADEKISPSACKKTLQEIKNKIQAQSSTNQELKKILSEVLVNKDQKPSDKISDNKVSSGDIKEGNIKENQKELQEKNKKNDSSKNKIILKPGHSVKIK
jgi:hypothetical protein